MAQISAKRRREDGDVRRPKKKVRKVKKQADYHSSSDDDGDVPEGVPTARRVLPVKPTGINAEPIGKRVKSKNADKTVQAAQETPKPILRRAPLVELKNAAVSKTEGDEDDNEEEDIVIDETERNTALNMAPGIESADEDEEYESAQPNPSELENEISDDDDGVELPLVADSDDSDLDLDNDSFSDTQSTTSSAAARNKKKRNDPTAFSTSISKILETKLTMSKRADPVLSRSKSASEANRSIADSKLEAKARTQIRGEKRAIMNKGRVEDVLGLGTEGVDTGKVMEEEKRLMKTAQRGVVKLFNAVRAAQVKADCAMQQAKQEGVVGMDKREERVKEMSKQGFLELISAGGK